MFYILAALLPPIGLLLNGQPFSALLNVLLLVMCFILGWFFPILFLVPSAHAIIAVHMARENRRHRELVDAIERHGPPPGFRPNARYGAPSSRNISCTWRRSGRSSSVFLKSAMAPSRSPLRIFAWPRLFQE